MLRDIRLRFWPTYYDCLRWSQGGEIAILANEYVYLLVPSKEDSKNIKGTPQFQATKAEIRASQRDDVVINEPGHIYSIGEEQGPGHVKAVEWSPLGVSQRRGCMLAVLTTTHRLKVFQPHGHPAKQWKAIYDVGQLIEDYDGWGKPENSRTQRLRIRSRTMAWSYKCEFDHLKWGQSVLAVANDNLEVALILISSDSCTIATIFRPRKSAGPGFYPKMSWSPWRTLSPTKAESYFSVSHKGTVTIHRVIMVREQQDTTKMALFVNEEESYEIGKGVTEAHPILAMAWYDKKVDGHWLLVYALQRVVRVAAIKCDVAEVVAEKTMHVWEIENGYIDPVSGLLICPSPTSPNSVEIHLSTILGNTQIIDWNFDLQKALSCNGPRLDGQASNTSLITHKEKQDEHHWAYRVQEKKQDFIAEWDINSATCKVWGIARSPLGGIIAVVVSLEPDDSLQYVTHSKETSRLLFGTCIDGRDMVEMVYGKKSLPSVTISSSENFITECANLYDVNTVQSDLGFQALKRAIKFAQDPSGTLHFPRLSPNLPRINLINTLSPNLPRINLINTLSRNIYDPPHLTALRLAVCLRLFPQCRRDDGSMIIPLHKDESVIVASLVMNILRAGMIVKAQDPLSYRIIYTATMIGIVGLWHFGITVLEPCLDSLNWLKEHCPNYDFRWEEKFIAKAMEIEAAGEDPMDTIEEKQAELSGIEDKMVRCNMCGGAFKWEDMVVAECTGGHRYPRCGITYLPIQSGDKWKSCVICERSVFEMERENDIGDGSNTEDSLLSLLLNAWDICVHCGGRYR